MSDQHCLGCGRLGPVELHHLAGRHNISELVVPVCTECHLILTNWQYAAGLELHADALRSDLDIHRALCVGVTHLVQLIDLRSETPAAPPGEGLWQLTGRAMSKVLDLAAAPERAGRWLPDSHVEPHTVAPVAIDPDSEAAQVREFCYLIAALLRLVGDAPPMTAAVWDLALADTRSLPQRLAVVNAGDHAGPSLAILIAQHLDVAHRVVLWLLHLDDWTAVDERDLDEARIWIDTGQRILDKMARAAMTTLDGDAA